jgi:hypothetical protein
MIAYVDDINAQMIHNTNQTNQQIKHERKRNAVIKEKILYISGGKLSAAKCTYYTNKCKFSTTKRPKQNPVGIYGIDGKYFCKLNWYQKQGD